MVNTQWDKRYTAKFGNGDLLTFVNFLIPLFMK